MISKDKQYRTIDGHDVRIYAVDGRDDEVHGSVKLEDGWVLCSWNYIGRCNNLEFGDFFNLTEVKPRIQREVWVNVYPHYTAIHVSKEHADQGSLGSRVACVKLMIDCFEGEGL